MVQVQECRAETRTRRVQVTNYQTVSEVGTETVPVTPCVAVTPAVDGDRHPSNARPPSRGWPPSFLQTRSPLRLGPGSALGASVGHLGRRKLR
jgi:hypothetical protein